MLPTQHYILKSVKKDTFLFPLQGKMAQESKKSNSKIGRIVMILPQTAKNHQSPEDQLTIRLQKAIRPM